MTRVAESARIFISQPMPDSIIHTNEHTVALTPCSPVDHTINMHRGVVSGKVAVSESEARAYGLGCGSEAVASYPVQERSVGNANRMAS
jgi:hypothetical protein